MVAFDEEQRFHHGATNAQAATPKAYCNPRLDVDQWAHVELPSLQAQAGWLERSSPGAEGSGEVRMGIEPTCLCFTSKLPHGTQGRVAVRTAGFSSATLLVYKSRPPRASPPLF